MSEADKKSAPAAPQLPKEAQVMVAILRDLGITDFDPGVVTQMLEYSYRYTTNVLEDAKMFSNHARKKTVDIDDVRLAVQIQSDQTNTMPPPREVLLELAHVRNNTQLPLIKAGAGLRLPPDRHCLTATNYRLRSVKPSSSGSSAFSGSGGASSSKSNGVASTSTPTFNIQVDPSNTLKRKWDDSS